MTQAGITDVRDLAISAASAAAVARFDALIDDLYYYRVGVLDRLDAASQVYEACSRRAETVDDAAAVRAALRWDVA